MKNNIQRYDIIVIGAGSGGLNVASFFARIKLTVLLIDKSDNRIGGDCLNTGCVPSKALIHVANQVHESQNANRFFMQELQSQVDIKRIMAHIRAKQDFIRQNENPEYLKNKGITYKSGIATFINKNTISLDGVEYTAKKFILATGSRPREFNSPNDNSIPLYTNESIFSINFLPKQFVFIGGGPINCEPGQAFARLGSTVTVLNAGSRILEKETENTSSIVAKEFEKENITIINSVTVKEIQNKKIVYAVSGETTERSVEADAVFIGIGRVLNIEGLGLEKAGIAINENKTKLVVDEYLRTTNKNIFVVGDVAGNYQFTHAAEMHAQTVITNILSPKKKKYNSKHIAWVTYTTPEVATWGITYDEAKKRGSQIIEKDFRNEDRAIVDENQVGNLTLYLDTKDQIIGGTMVAHNAGELAQELILAMSAKLPVRELFKKVYPYPTASRINKQIIAEYMARKLNNTNSTILRILFKYIA